MRKVMSRLKTIAAVCAVVLGTTLNAYAHVNPQDVAERCVSHVDSVVERAENAIAEDTLASVEEIRRLIRAGRNEAAHAVARQCAQDAEEIVRLATAEIGDTCEECIRYLVNVGMGALARRVYNYGEESEAGFAVLLARQQAILAEALRE